MPNINTLNLSDEELPLDLKTMPAGLGTRPRTPQPGIYRFRLPEAPAINNAFDVMDSEDSQILVAVFNAEAMLFNVTLNQYYVARINNRFREIKVMNKETGEREPVLISDYGLLLNALKAEPERISNRHLAAALVQCAGTEFIAEHTLTARCNPKQPIYKDGKPVQGKFGCDKNYAVEAWKGQKSERHAIPMDGENKIALRFTCTCGNELRSWGQLQGFRSV
jgi:hypothetical protein